MKTLQTLLAIGLLCAFTTAARAETCGEMIASKAVLPATMVKVMTSVSDMYQAHAAFMATNKTPASKKEQAALTKLSKEFQTLAKAFAKNSANMTKMATLPAADHDMAAMQSDPKIGAAMAGMLASHKEMLALLQKEVAEMEAMAGKKN